MSCKISKIAMINALKVFKPKSDKEVIDTIDFIFNKYARSIDQSDGFTREEYLQAFYERVRTSTEEERYGRIK